MAQVGMVLGDHGLVREAQLVAGMKGKSHNWLTLVGLKIY